MDFIFKDNAKLKTDILSQGDIIARTPQVVDAIGQAHQYYAEAPLYTHFVVITQSCDLVKRGGDFNAPYITIAAAKPLKKSFAEYLSEKSRIVRNADFSFHPTSVVGKAKQQLERHLNNTEPDYFFLPKSSSNGVEEDLLVYLRLSIALRKDHYDILAAAKVAELDDIFQAKLGWLKGNIYSRVATPDLDEREADSATFKRKFYEEYIPSDEMVLLSMMQAERLRKVVKGKSTELARALTNEEVLTVIEEEIPRDAEILADSIVERMIKNKVIDRDDVDKIRLAKSSITNEPSVKTLIGRS